MRWRFFARRLAMLVASLLVASFVIFAALYLAPGNPVAALGKTTIARMIVGLERPTSGTITACGHDRSAPTRSARDRRRRGREVQIVFQDPYTSLDPRQSGFQAIDEILRLHHDLAPDARKQRADELIELVGLDERQARALP